MLDIGFFNLNEVECPVCLEKISDYYVPPLCQHPCCFLCLEKLSRDRQGRATCPVCCQVFDIPFELLRSEIRYCLEIHCPKDKACNKVHIDEIFPISVVDVPVPDRVNEGCERVQDSEPEAFHFDKDMPYCCDLRCQGGKEAKCGKLHENDIFSGPHRL